MIYVMSDLHGCYDKYKQMLKKIKFNDDDTLYVLGDVIDRGNDGIKILLDMMKRPNVVPMLGNHEYMAYSVLKKFNPTIDENDYSKHLDEDTMNMFELWLSNGGVATVREFLELEVLQREKIIEYLGEFELYEELEVNGNSFVLVHGGLVDFDENKDLSEYDLHNIIWERCDYSRQYYSDKYLVTGHTPTYNIDVKYKGKIYKKNNHIAIDCGAVYGGRLGCICLDTLEEDYV